MFALLKHPLVDCDFEEAALHYALKDAGLAERFIEVAESSLRELANAPFRHRIRFDDIRRLNLPTFPYGIFYFVREESIYVIALLHGARDHEAALSRRRAMWGS